jgi:hypothetical protein
MNVRLLIVALVVGVAVVVRAQPAPGPTMDETKAWLESDGKDLMHANRLQGDRQRLIVLAAEEHIDTITLTDCVLTWRMVRSRHTTTAAVGGSRVSPTTTHTVDVNLVLRELSLGGITADSDSLLTDKPIAVVRFLLRQPREATSTLTTDAGNPVTIKAASLPVQSPEDAQRIVNAIRHAATLCGVAAGGLF